MLVASKLSGKAGALGAEAIELRNWLLCFRCASDDFIVIIANLADWMANSSPPLAAYCSLVAFFLVALYKSPGVRTVEIVEILLRAVAKLVIRVAGNQANTACGSLQL